MEKMLSLEDIVSQLGIKAEHFEKWQERNLDPARTERIAPSHNYLSSYNISVEPHC
ncbi:hypothetical protein [Paenibacillus beijingensis]|uniref:hypothetical protein n=1 Tax=Paenibacillus beijingensis TaxID=1126833 RepID=UPI000AEFE14A|nr:hypothetical protein [Paenibacillus beijingensis]